jgi:hypothetical protein
VNRRRPFGAAEIILDEPRRVMRAAVFTWRVFAMGNVEIGRSAWAALSDVFYYLAKPFVSIGTFFIGVSDYCNRRA